MSEQIKRMIDRYVETLYTAGDLDQVSEFLGEDYVNHTPLQDVQGIEGARQFAGMIRTAFPDSRETIEDQIAEGNKEVHRWIIRGTHKGEFMGIPATGKEVVVHGITIARIDDDKIVEEWSQFDVMGLLQQLGALPAPEKAAN